MSRWDQKRKSWEAFYVLVSGYDSRKRFSDTSVVFSLRNDDGFPLRTHIGNYLCVFQ